MSADKPLRGVSFPFRIGKRGGVVMSESDLMNQAHVEEGMEQILSTFKFERGMEPNFYSELDTSIFTPNDESARTLIEYQITDALRKHMPYVEVHEVKVTSTDNILYAEIGYTIVRTSVSGIARVTVREVT